MALLVGVAILAIPTRHQVLSDRKPARGSRSQRTAPFRPEAECLAVLESMVVLLRAGTPTGHALDLATRPVRREETEGAAGWSRLVRAAQADDDVAACWNELAQEWDATVFDDVAAAWRMASRHGCPIADALEAAAEGIRAQRRHGAAVEAAVAGARSTMTVLMVLPVVGVGLGVLLGVDMLDVYAGPSGFLTLWPGLLLLGVGRRWARRIVSGALRPVAGGGVAI